MQTFQAHEIKENEKWCASTPQKNVCVTCNADILRILVLKKRKNGLVTANADNLRVLVPFIRTVCVHACARAREHAALTHARA
jgi:hypothetical protein